ncbi:MAG: hypothetical protein O2956_01435, partial [Gemmatimonadetes bacterium]|nr:hypothetical protein [Gemmatimonadota bacterium]
TDWIIAFASHNQNYLYNLTTDQRVQIPDRSDAVATPDGRYMTVPSNYTPDSNTRFYPVAPMLEALAEGRDIADLEPVFIHDHPSMHRVYYQSTSLLSEVDTDSGLETTYRLMFSGTADQSGFRVVDYLFRHNADSGALLGVEASEPMAVCPAVQNDLNTPFISKDGRYIAAYTSEVAGNAFATGASLKIFEITGADPSAGTMACTEVADVGFPAGKADFSFDGSMLTFHLSQGAYLTPFVNGGLPSSTITDVVVARLDRDPAGRISGYSGLQRLSTSMTAGVGSYFPAFLPDGNLFFLANTAPRDSEAEKRFRFRVVDPGSRGWRTTTLASDAQRDLWTELGTLWQAACMPSLAALQAEPFPLDAHELSGQALALSPKQCEALISDARAEAHEGGTEGPSGRDWDGLTGLCRAIEP